MTSEAVTLNKEDLQQIVRAEIDVALRERGITSRRSTPARVPLPWDRVRTELEARLKDMPGSEVDRYQTLGAVMTAIRRALRLTSVRFIPPEREAEAREIGHAVLDLMKVPRSPRGEETPAREAGTAPVEGET